MSRRYLPGLAVLVLTTALISESRADDKQQPPAKAVNAATAALIDKLTEVAEISHSRSPFGPLQSRHTSAGNFAPLQGREWDPLTIEQKPIPPLDVFRELVKLGLAAIPDLVAHLDDKRPTRLTVRNGFGDSTMLNNEGGKSEPVDSYTLKVSDLCYAALGQIVNRPFDTVQFFGPAKIVSIFTPTRDAKTREKLKKEWGEFTPDQHRKSLLKDCENKGNIELQAGAFLRLSWYYPDALEAPALRFLARPTYCEQDVDEFVRKKLYIEADVKKRRELLDTYVHQFGDAAHDGIRQIMYTDLFRVETLEEIHSEPDAFGDKPRQLLIELYGAPKTVKSEDKPSPESISAEKLAAFIECCLTYDRSAKIDRAVRDLLAKTTENRVALACMNRLVGRGFDTEIEAYCRRNEKALDRLTAYQKAQFTDFIQKAGWSPLHVAIWREQQERLTELLREGNKVNARAKDGRMPLHIAAAEGNMQAVIPLLEAGADQKATDAQGQTPVTVASFQGNTMIVRELIAAGGPISDILVAATVGKAEEVAAFMRKDKEAHKAKDRAGLTPLHRAAEEGQLKVIRLLLDAGVEVDVGVDGEWTPLHIAAAYGQADACELLIQRNAKIEGPVNGYQAIHFAAMYGRLEVVKLLVKNGVKVDARDGAKGTPLIYAAADGRIAVVKWLVDQRADINAKNKHGYNALSWALQNGHEEVGAFLTKNGATFPERDPADDRGGAIK